MPRAVTYDRQTFDNPNPLARLAHGRRLRFAMALVDRHVDLGGRLLDIGAGTGAFLHRLAAIRPDIERIAFEPFMPISVPGLLQVRALDHVADNSAAAISAFEVLEHLADVQIDEFVRHTRRILRSDGRLVLSMPIMQGMALPVKEASRAILFRRLSDYRMKELALGAFGRPVERAANLLTSHKGFEHRALRKRFDTEFRSISHLYSPFPAFPWWLNSQIFLVYALPSHR